MAKTIEKKKVTKNAKKIEIVIYGEDGKKLAGILCINLFDALDVILGLLGSAIRG